MRVIGLTGGIACGKSHISSQLSALGVPIIDGDLLSPGADRTRRRSAARAARSLRRQHLLLRRHAEPRRAGAARLWQAGRSRPA